MARVCLSNQSARAQCCRTIASINYFWHSIENRSKQLETQMTGRKFKSKFCFVCMLKMKWKLIKISFSFQVPNNVYDSLITYWLHKAYKMAFVTWKAFFVGHPGVKGWRIQLHMVQTSRTRAPPVLHVDLDSSMEGYNDLQSCRAFVISLKQGEDSNLRTEAKIWLDLTFCCCCCWCFHLNSNKEVSV